MVQPSSQKHPGWPCICLPSLARHVSYTAWCLRGPAWSPSVTRPSAKDWGWGCWWEFNLQLALDSHSRPSLQAQGGQPENGHRKTYLGSVKKVPEERSQNL